MQLNVFDICREGTHMLGPGNRYVIWVQGCNQKCKGCITPESRDKSGGIKMECKDIAADIILSENINGVTVSGGEPFLQPDALCELLKEVKLYRPELTIIIYTGYELSNLRKDPEAERLVSYADLIVDGPYIESLNDNKGIRGSSNQQFHSITTRLNEYVEIMENCKRKQTKVGDSNGLVTKIGVPAHSK